MEDADNGEAVHVWEQGLYKNSLYFLLNFLMLTPHACILTQSKGPEKLCKPHFWSPNLSVIVMVCLAEFYLYLGASLGLQGDQTSQS